MLNIANIECRCPCLKYHIIYKYIYIPYYQARDTELKQLGHSKGVTSYGKYYPHLHHHFKKISQVVIEAS